MDFFKNFDFSVKNILRVFGIGIAGLIFLIIAVWFVGFAFRTAFNNGSNSISNGVPSYQGIKEAGSVSSDGLSIRNIAPEIIPDESAMGTYNEKDFEVTEYSGVIKTTNFNKTCSRIESLKDSDYVIFDNSNTDDYGCYFSFKVKNDKADEVLKIIKDYKPESLQTNKYTLKNIIDDYTSEIDILNKKLASVEKTLTEAQSAYDQVTILATKTQNVESLAKIIDSKIQLIERLTKERIDTKEKIDRLNKTKIKQADSIEYTFFRINVYDVVIFDFKQIKNSWVSELKQFVFEFNSMIQNITVGLASYLLKLIQIVIYLFIALFVVKYGWRVVKFIWKK